MEEGEIRKAKEDDMEEINTFVRNLVQVMNTNGNFQWDATYPLKEHFLEDIRNGELYVYCLKGGKDKVVGVVAVTAAPCPEYSQTKGVDLSIPGVTPHRLGVSLDYQGKGIAKRLLMHADEVCKSKGWRFIRIDTNKVNTVMQRLISSCSFTFKGEITLNKKPGFVFYCYEKMLA